MKKRKMVDMWVFAVYAAENLLYGEVCMSKRLAIYERWFHKSSNKKCGPIVKVRVPAPELKPCGPVTEIQLPAAKVSKKP